MIIDSYFGTLSDYTHRAGKERRGADCWNSADMHRAAEERAGASDGHPVAAELTSSGVSFCSGDDILLHADYVYLYHHFHHRHARKPSANHCSPKLRSYCLQKNYEDLGSALARCCKVFS